MKLKDLIATLETLDPALPMEYPYVLDSWRGRYAELTIFPARHDRGGHQTVGELLALARAADGGTFTGYKGGNYTMDADTTVWADGYGCYDHDYPAGFVVESGIVRMCVGSVPSEYRY